MVEVVEVVLVGWVTLITLQHQELIQLVAAVEEVQ